MDCRHIEFSCYKDKVDIYQLQHLFKIAAFWAQNRTIADLEIALANSNPVISVWDKAKMIGFARAISDGIYRATIWDVVIHPEYRGLGLGTKLVESILIHPLVNRVERVYLMTTHQQKFYQKIGFQENQTTTMVINNFDRCNTNILEEQIIRDHQEFQALSESNIVI